jgi:hypothetical protein
VIPYDLVKPLCSSGVEGMACRVVTKIGDSPRPSGYTLPSER